MADKGYVLNANDLAIFKELVRWWQQRKGSTGRETDHSLDHQEMMTPECYIARVPVDGIPGLDVGITGTGSGSATDNVPGYADDVDIYRIIQQSGGLDATGTGDVIPLLQQVHGVSRRVYNLSPCEIEDGPGDRWIPVVRDKYGSWLSAYDPHCPEDSSCPDPGWDECYRMVHRAWSECVGNQIVSHEDVTFWRLCNLDIVSISDDPCPGEGGDDTGTGVSECINCEGVTPTTITLTVPAIGSTTCGDCDFAAGTDSLPRNEAQQCTWDSVLFTLCDTPGAYWRVIKQSTVWQAILYRQPGDQVVLAYQSGFVDESCALPVDLSLISQSGECEGTATVTIS